MLKIVISRGAALTFALLAAACSHPAPPAPPAPRTPPAAQTPPPPAAPARQAPPPPLPERPVQFPPFHEAALPNGLRLIVVEKHDLPVVNVDLYVQSGDASDTQARAGLASMTADMLTKGTKTRSAKEIATLIESAGGQLDASSGADYSTISSTALKAQIPLLFDLVSDVALHPTFPTDELETARKRAISGLQASLGQASFVAQRIFSRALYGQANPYGFLETPQTLQAITRADVQRFYQAHYQPGNALLVVSGDVDAASIERMARKAFGGWEGKGPQPITMPAPPTVDSTHILLVNRPGSVQSNILVGDVTFRPDDPDFYPLQVLNQIVGGGSNARLFRILREEKGWTYGAYSQLSRPKDVGYFVASAEVRTPVTDSSLTEMLAQLRRVRTEVVPDSELASAKSFLVGSYPLRLQTAGQVARQVARTRLLGLPLEDLTQYREKIQAVTAADVQRVARQYVRPGQALVVVVGDAAALYPELQHIAPTSVLDVEGKPVDAASLEVKGVP